MSSHNKNSMSSRIRAGVIGVGYVGRFHAQKYAQQPDVELVGVLDLDKERAEEVAGEVGCAVVESVEELIKKVDAVSIAVPASEHAEVAAPFLDAGVAVLIEKPIALTLDEADELVQRAAKAGALLQVGHLERFNGAVERLGEILAADSDPWHLEAWRLGPFVERVADVDVVIDLMIHDIDLILWLLQSPVVSVEAIGNQVVTDKLDVAAARLTFESGCVATLSASRVTASPQRHLHVYHNSVAFALNFAEQTLTRVNKAGKPSALPFPSPEPPLFPADDCEIIIPGKVDTIAAEIRAFLDAYRNRSMSPVSGEEARDALAVALQVREAIESSE